MAVARTYTCDLCHLGNLSDGDDDRRLMGIVWQTSSDGVEHLKFNADYRSVEHHLCQRCIRDIKRGEMTRP